MIKDIQTASFFLKDGLNDNSSFHWCFCPGDEGGPSGNEGEGEGGYGGVDLGDPTGVDSSIDVGPKGFEPGILDLNYETYEDIPTEQQFDPIGLFVPEDPIDPFTTTKRYRKPIIPIKIPSTYALADPVRMLSKMDRLVDRETATELSKNYLEMLTEAGLEAKVEGKEGLADEIQKELDKGLLADYYQDYGLLNELENVGYKSFGTGYRGEFEARTGAENQSVTRDQYDPSTITGSDPSERSSKISLFNQFALENPDMTAMEAMAAFNKIGSFGTISAVDLGMLGYSPNTAIGPQAASNEDQRERGVLQGLEMFAKLALGGGPLSAVSMGEKMAFSGTPNTGIFDTLLDGIEQASLEKDSQGNVVPNTGIVSGVDRVYNQNFANPISEAFNTAATDLGNFVDRNVNSIFDFFSPEEEATYNPAMGMADPNLAGRSGVSYTGSPFSGLPSDTFENYTNALAGLEEAERAEVLSGIPVDPSMGLADPAFAVQGQLQPGSFFKGLDPAKTQEYIDRATTPEGVKLIRQRQPGRAAPPSTIDDQFSPLETENFFPGSFNTSTATSQNRTQTLMNLYGISEDEANRMLGIA